MAANEHNPYREQALRLRLQAYTNAAHAVLGMRLALNEDRPLSLRHLVAKLDGRDGPEQEALAWDALQRMASQITGKHHGRLSPEEQAKVVDTLTNGLALIGSEFVGFPS